MLDGGSGNDTALFAQEYDAYDIDFDDDQTVIEEGGSKTTLVDIEQAIFADGTELDIDSGDTSTGSSNEAPSAESILDDNDSDEDEEDDAPSSRETTDSGTSSKDEDEDIDAPELTLDSEVHSAWSGGYMAEVFVENTSDTTLSNPELHFDLSEDLDKLWNGQVSEVDDGYQVTHDGSLAPGDVWRFGFKADNANGSGDDLATGEAAPLIGLETPSFDLSIL
ncbi:cellulose binding domain-containing protein [Halomonas sp. IOP_31]|nr:cellulose binding domain-containing protein [Halomonas sp. IOP_31]